MVFIETQVFFGEAEAFGLNSTKKNLVSMKPPQVSSSYSKVTRETIIFGPIFIETVKQKKNERFPLKTFQKSVREKAKRPVIKSTK